MPFLRSGQEEEQARQEGQEGSWSVVIGSPGIVLLSDPIKQEAGGCLAWLMTRSAFRHPTGRRCFLGKRCR